MRTLSRPMFNMGGPIKQGIMHGIREPYKGGGKAALVGNPVYPRTGGREHHALVLGAAAPWAMRGLATLPKIWRGMKTARTFAPGTLGAWNRFKSMLGPSGRFRDYKGPKIPLGGTGTTKGQLVPYGAGVPTSGRYGLWKALRDPTRFGQAIRENPLTVASLATAPHAIGSIAPGTWDLTKKLGRGYRKMVFGDLFEPDPPPTGVTLPGGGETAEGSGAAYYSKAGKEKLKPLTKAQQEKWADAQRGKRLNNLLDIMGYDRSKKTAIADALIDASKIVSDRGTLDKKNITAELINPIIQATSKRLDKPEQIREAVGLMMAKGEIEKDLYKWKPGTALKNAQDMADTLGITVDEALRRQSKMATNVGESILSWQVTKKSTPTATEIEQITRNYANENNIEFQQVFTAEEVEKAGGKDKDSLEIIADVVSKGGGDGFYQVDKDVIKVTNGVPKKHW